MVIKKTMGYVLAIIGLAGLAVTSIPELEIEAQTKIPQLATIDNTTLTIASVVILVIGIILALKKSTWKKAGIEVPIFKGKEIVGYRRH